MKNKFIYFLIILLLVVPTVTLAVGEVNIPVQDADYNDAMILINNIQPNLTLPEENERSLSRAEFTQAMVSLLGVSIPETSDTGLIDVPSTHPASGSIYYAMQMGAINSQTMFYPEDEISFEQALKMLVVATGYIPKAEIAGGYPNGYILTAASIGLTDDVRGKIINKRNAVILFYNMLTTDLMQQTGFGETTTYEVKRNQTILTKYHKIESTTGVVGANKYTSIYSPKDKLNDNCILIDTEIYFVEQDFNHYLGYNVTAYYKEIDAENYIVCMIPERNDDITLLAENIVNCDSNTVYYQDNVSDKEIKYKLYSSFQVIKNGKAIVGENPMDYIKPESGKIKLVDNNLDGLYDIVFVEEIKYLYVSSVDVYGEIIYDKNKINGMLDLSNDDCVYKVYEVWKDEKKETKLTAVQSGKVIAYMASEDNLLYEIQICTEFVNGTVTGVDITNNEVYINNEPYRVSEYCKSYYPISVNLSGNFYIGSDGSVVVFNTDSNIMRYGWVVKIGEENSVISESVVKLFDQDGTMKIYALAEKISIDGTYVSASTTKILLNNKINSQNDGDRFLRYGINAAGKIYKLDIAMQADNVSQYQKNYVDDNSLMLFFSGNLKYKSTPKIFVSKFAIDDSTICFVIPNNTISGVENYRNDDEKYKIVSSGNFANDVSYNIWAYNVGADGRAKAILVIDSASSNIVLDSNSAIIEKVVKSVDDTETQVYEVSLWSNGTYYNLRTYGEEVKKYIEENSIQPGDIVRFVTNNNKAITSMDKDYTFSTNTIASDCTSSGAQLEYISGRICSYQNGYMNIVPQSVINDAQDSTNISLSSVQNINVSRGKLIFVNITKKTVGGVTTVKKASVYSAPASTIKD